jgi:hypothetical protein
MPRSLDQLGMVPPRATGDLVRDLRGMDVAFSPVSNDG